MFLVTYEAKDGTWMDDPNAFDSRKEAIEDALKKWPKEKLRPGEAIVLYTCYEDDVIAECPEEKTLKEIDAQAKSLVDQKDKT